MGIINWYKNTSVGVKIAIAPVLTLIGLIVVGIVSITTTTKMQSMLQTLAEERLPNVTNIISLAPELTRLNGEIFRSIALDAAGFSKAEIKQVDDATIAALDALDVPMKKLSEAANIDEEQALLRQDIAKEFIKYHRSAMRALRAKVDTPVNAVGYLSAMEISYEKMKKNFDLVVSSEIEQAQQLTVTGKNISTRDLTIIVACLVLACILAVTVSALSVHVMGKSLKRASDVAKSMSEGNFTDIPEVTSRDATGQVLLALAKVSDHMGKIVTAIRESAGEVYQTSEKIANGNEDLSHRAENVSHALKETAVTLEQLSVNIKTSADGATEASKLASKTRDVAHEGERAMKDVVETMVQIDRQAKDINEIVNVIDSIAFQTNILSLNAAVEAARAGQQGKGFAVVAEEVRALAQRSSNAAHEVRALISSSVSLINNGSQKVQNAGNTMSGIMQSIEKLTQVVQDISQALTEQSQGIAVVNQAVGHMDQNSRDNAEIVQHSTQVAITLEQQANRLTGLVSTLKADDRTQLLAMQ